MKRTTWQYLPQRVRQALIDLARQYQAEGAKLFVFGSFARSEAHPTSDLDIGVEWQEERQAEVFRQLYRDIQALPTIRPVDLVDFALVDQIFAQNVGADKIYLAELESTKVGTTNDEKAVAQS
jgi:predicted nucleotidyltransferase